MVGLGMAEGRVTTAASFTYPELLCAKPGWATQPLAFNALALPSARHTAAATRLVPAGTQCAAVNTFTGVSRTPEQMLELPPAPTTTSRITGVFSGEVQLLPFAILGCTPTLPHSSAALGSDTSSPPPPQPASSKAITTPRYLNPCFISFPINSITRQRRHEAQTVAPDQTRPTDQKSGCP